MRKCAIATLCIGNNYLRMGIGLMLSCYPFLRNELEYVVFYGNADPNMFKIPDWITLVEIELSYPIKNVWSGRQYKAIPLTHPNFLDKNVLFLDADTFVYENRLVELFRIIEQKSALVYGKYAAPTELWFKDDQNQVYLNLKTMAKLAGYDVENLHINSGILGRASDSCGLKFARTFARLLHDMELRPWLERSPKIACNDEPYASIAFQLSTREAGKGQFNLDYNTYQTTVGAEVTYERDGKPIIYKSHLNIYTKKCAIVHYVGHTRFPSYLEKIGKMVPLKT